jgi:hypothetical protein
MPLLEFLGMKQSINEISQQYDGDDAGENESEFHISLHDYSTIWRILMSCHPGRTVQPLFLTLRTRAQAICAVRISHPDVKNM